MQLSKQNNPLLLLTLISFLHPSLCHVCALWDRTCGPVSWVSCRFIQHWFMQLAVEPPLTAFGPAQPLTTNVSWQSWSFSCQPCSLPRFWSPHGIQGLHQQSFASIKWVLSTDTDYFIILFLLYIKCSWILPFNPTLLEFVFILCSFLGMCCLCPAVVCYNDTQFLFISLAGNEGWWGSNAGQSPPSHYCIFKVMKLCAPAERSGAICRKPEARICFTAWHLKCRILRNVFILKCLILCLKDSVSGRGKNI